MSLVYEILKPERWLLHLTAPPIPCYYNVHMTYEPLNEDDNQPATKGDVKAAVNTLRQELPEIFTGAVRNVINAVTNKVVDIQSKVDGLATKVDLEKWKDEIVKSNDRVAKDYKTFDTEKAAIDANYKNLDGRVEKLEKVTF